MPPSLETIRATRKEKESKYSEEMHSKICPYKITTVTLEATLYLHPLEMLSVIPWSSV